MKKWLSAPDNRGCSGSAAAFLTILGILASGCGDGSAALEERIARVEAGLIPGTGIVVKGRPVPSAGLAERMSVYRIPAVSIAVIDKNRISWARGYGVTDRESARAVTPDTLFQAASISKPVAAAAALKLVEEGRLDLDENVNVYLESWKLPENDLTAEKPVTLRRLLSHTAGLTVHGFRGYAAHEDVPALNQVLDGEAPANSDPIRVDTLPGSTWRYSGGGYTVMQRLLIDRFGVSFPQLLQESVLSPSGMSRSSYVQPLPEERAGEAAVAHRMNGKPIEGRWHTYPEMAAAGLWTTPTDLCRFALEVARAFQGESGALLASETAREMLTAVDGGYGLGFGIRGEGEAFSFSHSGGNEGFRCLLVMWPGRGQGASVMTNGDYGGNLYLEILRALAREYDWADFRVREKIPADLSVEQREAVTGIYDLKPAGKLRIRSESNRLFADPVYVIPTGRKEVELFPESPSEFFAVEADIRILFERNEEGEVTGFSMEQNRRSRRGTRVEDTGENPGSGSAVPTHATPPADPTAGPRPNAGPVLDSSGIDGVPGPTHRLEKVIPGFHLHSYYAGLAFCAAEFVGSGCKRLALSPAYTRAELAAMLESTRMAADEYGLPILIEQDFPVTPLFDASLTEGLSVILIAQDQAVLDEYRIFKKDRSQALAGGRMAEAGVELARRFGRLLSYSEDVIDRLLIENRR